MILIEYLFLFCDKRHMLYVLWRSETDGYMTNPNKPTHISLERSQREKTFIKEWKYRFLCSTPVPYENIELQHGLWHKEVWPVWDAARGELFDIQAELDPQYDIILRNCRSMKSIPNQEHMQCLKVKKYATIQDLKDGLDAG